MRSGILAMIVYIATYIFLLKFFKIKLEKKLWLRGSTKFCVQKLLWSVKYSHQAKLLLKLDILHNTW